MPRKIYDIKPPEATGKVRIVKEAKKPAKHRRKKKHFKGLSILICAAAIVFLVGVYLFFKLPKAEILIWPKLETLSFQETIKADKSAELLDVESAVIPAEYFEVTKTNSQNFPATGNASDEGRASGVITIYNKYDPPTPLTLRTGTHFMSDSGKLFVASQKIVVPAAQKSKGKITPGSVRVSVRAVEGGSDFNIPPSNFSVPGLKGTAFYYNIYAVSDSDMTGGYTGEIKKITDNDIQSAKDVLVSQTTSGAIADLKNQISSDYVILENAILSNVVETSTQTKSGTVAENFDYKATVRASTLAFKKSYLDQYVKNYIISKIPEGKTLLDNSLKINYSASVVDVSGGKATINIDFSSDVYQNINENSVALSLLGKNSDQISKTINNSLGDAVSGVQVKFWPFWVKSAPKTQKAIYITLKFQ